MPHTTPDDPATPSADAAHEQLVPATEPEHAIEHEEVEVESEHRVKVRRTPRYGRFMILGGAVFGVGAFIATYSFPQEEGYDRNTVFGFVLLASVAVGVGLGALAAIIASAATRRTERTVLADRIDVRRDADDSATVPSVTDLGELPAEAEHDASDGSDGTEGTDVAAKRDTE